jgi:hypothetical protein
MVQAPTDETPDECALRLVAAAVCQALDDEDNAITPALGERLEEVD